MRLNLALSLKVIMLIILASLSLGVWAQKFSAQVDRDQIKLDESFTLTLTYQGSANDSPDISDIEDQFNILQQSENNVRQINNGKIVSYRQWRYVLQAKQAGKLIIPSVKLDNEITDAIVVEVEKPVYKKSDSAGDIFFETEISTDKAYVQQQVLLKYKLYHRINFEVANHTLDSLNIDSIVLEPLEDTSYQANVNGKRYQVQEINYAIYPQSSKKIEIPSIEWLIRANATRFGRYQVKRLLTEKKSIEVLPIPASYPKNAVWLPSSNINLSEKWSGELEKLKTGEPITRTLTLQAEGLMKSQLPNINPQYATDAFSVYPEAPITEEQKPITGMTSYRQEKAAIVINQAGEISLPEVSIPWWNTKTDSLEYAKVPAKTISVKASSELIKQNRAASRAQELSPNLVGDSEITYRATGWLRLWQALCAILVFSTLAFAVLWRRALSQTSTNNDSFDPRTSMRKAMNKNAIYQNLASACASGDASRAREHLILWVQLHFENKQISTLDMASKALNNKTLTNHIQSLDAALFGAKNEQPWKDEKLPKYLLAWEKHQNLDKTKKADELRSLYPS